MFDFPLLGLDVHGLVFFCWMTDCVPCVLLIVLVSLCVCIVLL